MLSIPGLPLYAVHQMQELTDAEYPAGHAARTAAASTSQTACQDCRLHDN